MRHLNRTFSCLISTIILIFFIIYLIYAFWTTTKFNFVFTGTPSLRFSYALSQPLTNKVNENNFQKNSLIVSFDQIDQDFDKFSFKFSGEDTLIFLHIQKTAGTTFERFLVRKLNISNPCICEEGQKRCDCEIIDNFGKKRIWLFSRYSTGWVDWACGLHADFTKLVVANCVDYYFKIKEGQSKNRFYLTTFIREPIDRFISEFSHVKRGARWKRVQHFCNNMSECLEFDLVKEVELDEFLSCPHNLAFNRQTRMLADLTLIGCDNLIFSDTPTSHFGRLMLESAKKNLQNKFAFFGIKERMNEIEMIGRNTRSNPVSILDKSLSKGRHEINISTFALLFAEMIKYSQNKVNTVQELQERLTDYGKFVGSRLLDLITLREKGYKKDVKLLHMLMFLKGPVWKNLFGLEADKLERSNEDPCKYFLIEKEPMVNTFISLPKDKGSLNCASFIAGIIEAFLAESNFPCRVTAHWHMGTAYMIEFEEQVITRENIINEMSK
uniref:Trafficking protein particle complex subunit 5 n=5 Tax=Meloidogyne TaxID=189290 RepID=A0A915NDL2_MELJA